MTDGETNQAGAVLITGGAGYIGATVASACLDAGITPVILDNLSTGRSDTPAGVLRGREEPGVRIPGSSSGGEHAQAVHALA